MMTLVQQRFSCHLYWGFSSSCRWMAKFNRLGDTSLNKVVVTHTSETLTVGISFRYRNDDLRLNKIFNLQRSPHEQLNDVLEKISVKIQCAVMNKNRKRENIGVVEIPVKMIALGDKKEILCAQEDMTCHQSFVMHGSKHNLVIGKEEYYIDVNPPIIETAELPAIIVAGFLVNLKKLEVVFASREQCLFKWYVSDTKFSGKPHDEVPRSKHLTDKIKWVELGDGFFCMPTDEDIGRLLKVIVTPCSGERRGEAVEVLSSVVVSPGPSECPFQKRHHFTKEMAGDNSLRVISYNILAEMYSNSNYAREELFPTCPEHALNADYRKQLLIREIIGYNGDVICLQEVDEKVFFRDIEPHLMNEGFGGFYDAKGQISEGLAIFFRHSKLRMLERRRLVLTDELQKESFLAGVFEKVQKSPDFLKLLSHVRTVLQVSVLESVEDPSRLIVIGATHLFFHPNASHIRTLQAGISISILNQVIMHYRNEYPDKEVSLLFCGDFNSTPESAVYRFMTKQHVGSDDDVWKSKYSECVEGMCLSHDLDLASACGCPPYTTYTVTFSGCLDYIFYQTDKFIVKQVIPMPSHQEVTEYGALPSVTFPSDHIPLIADLEFRKS
ncbi:LOW QUALITY PROTEIN: 2',5'-phosphodiesterase 12 [Procambarus clarkii]|uniref:LOW QUALITY PROTEIN: 2',5'-phosphodiesterase 12 n=1 Tax=Procambarus clarkii TaxID=6728 RepID=UPI00374312D9